MTTRNVFLTPICEPISLPKCNQPAANQWAKRACLQSQQFLAYALNACSGRRPAIAFPSLIYLPVAFWEKIALPPPHYCTGYATVCMITYSALLHGSSTVVLHDRYTFFVHRWRFCYSQWDPNSKLNIEAAGHFKGFSFLAAQQKRMSVFYILYYKVQRNLEGLS